LTDILSTSFILVQLISVLNVLFAGIWLGQVLMDIRDHAGAWRLYSLITVLSILITQSMNYLFRRYCPWHAHPTFPSGHMMFAMSFATSLTIRECRWLWLLTPLLLLLGTAIVVVKMHEPIDVIGSIFITPPLTWLLHWIVRDPTLKHHNSAPI
jgi:membrane-associated phospholipid phosphatase